MKKLLNHIFIDGLSGMALGLFSTLIVGTIIQQIGNMICGNQRIFREKNFQEGFCCTQKSLLFM